MNTRKRCTKCQRNRTLRYFYAGRDGLSSWCIDCHKRNRARNGGKDGYSPRLRRVVGRAHITGRRELDLRKRVAAYLSQTPLAEHNDSIAAALLDALDDLRDARSMCNRLRASVRAHGRRIGAA